MTKIGFVGLGHMGLPMAINLCKAGYDVTGYDINAGACDAFAAQGGIVAGEAIDAICEQDILITMLQTGSQVQQICLDDNLYAHGSAGLLHIDCSTIDIKTCRHLFEQATMQGIHYLDAPVSGGVLGAEAGTLTFMVGGEHEAFIRAQSILECMGKKIFHCGIPGNGQAAKICNNMILGISMVAVSEAFALAEQLGLSDQKLFEVVTNASGQCWAMSHYAPVAEVLPSSPANRNYEPGFTTAMMLKDLRLSQEAAQENSVQTVLGLQALAMYELFANNGGRDLDFSAIIKQIKARPI